MAELLVGPLLRYVGDDEATVWVETDSPAEVEVHAGTASGSQRTFHVSGHHYALVHVTGLEPSRITPYRVALDGEHVWPRPGDPWPDPSIPTTGPDDAFHLAFGSCRVSVPHDEPYTLTKDQDPRGREIDALQAYALRMRDQRRELWPQLLFLCGDQIYADEVSPETQKFIEARRDTSKPPGDEVADFEEYTRLYWESWRDPAFRWLLSTVSSAMIFDDHDVHDDWNTSREWVDEYRRKPWWEARIDGAFASYWVYQHLGNLSPRHLAEDELYARVREADDAGPLLGEAGHRDDRGTDGTRWSYCRDLGGCAKLVVMDSRAGRVLDPGDRRMVDEAEWKWIESEARGDVDHLLLGTSLPVILAPAMHDLEAWNEAVSEGAWGKLAARAGEKLRQALDLEHWAAFGKSFAAVADLTRAVGSGERGTPPSTIVALSGDVHHAYLAEVGYPKGSDVRSAVYQAVCSPVRNPLDKRERRALRAMRNRAVTLVMRALSRAAGVPPPRIRWQEREGPWFDNQIASLTLHGASARLKLERALPGEAAGVPRLDVVMDRELSLSPEAT